MASYLHADSPARIAQRESLHCLCLPGARLFGNTECILDDRHLRRHVADADRWCTTRRANCVITVGERKTNCGFYTQQSLGLACVREYV